VLRLSTPIINIPQSAILGMHGIFPRPVAVKGQVEIRPMMYIALTYDHRLIDGREAVTFLKRVKELCENPSTRTRAMPCAAAMRSAPAQRGAARRGDHAESSAVRADSWCTRVRRCRALRVCSAQVALCLVRAVPSASCARCASCASCAHCALCTLRHLERR
jgi:hypothetical protein